MNYLSLARRYRPKNLEEVVGQTNVVQVLRHMLDRQRLPHAFLFSGSHGTGKTSIARLLAKCLVCVQGVSAQPCGVCKHCVAIQKGNLMDFVEMDAASNRKIENLREILEEIQFHPHSCRYKIYLLDEAHMLTTEAMNALLKVLEEPPSYIIFMFATTDMMRLADTIVSRCLVFLPYSIKNPRDCLPFQGYFK